MSSIDRLKTSRRRVRWAKLDPDNDAFLHEPKRHGDVGWDLEASETVTIEPGQAIDVPTNVRIELPEDVWAEIRARSSIARRGLQVDAGTIDPGYRGPLFALVRNMTQPKPNELFQYWTEAGSHRVGFRPFRFYMDWKENRSVTIEKGERVAQVVFHRVTPVWLEEVPTDALDFNTHRGEGGFGSTGR